MTEPFAVAAESGRKVTAPTGDTVIIRADGLQTGGAMSVVEIVVTPMNGPALHRHTLDDELWFVLEGEFRFRAGDATLHASTGGMAYGPRGIAHCFQNIGASDGRLLVVTAPSGLDQFFLDHANAPGDGSLEALNAAAARYGVEFLGPPLAISNPL